MSLVAAMLVAAALGGAPTFSVIVSRRVGLEPAAGLDLAESLSLAIERHPKPLGQRLAPRAMAVTLAAANTPDSASCAGSVDCVSALGKIAGVDRLVAIQVVKIGADVVVDAALVNVAARAHEATASQKLPLKKPGPGLDKLADAIARNAPAWVEAPAPPPPPPPPKPVADVPPAKPPGEASEGTTVAVKPDRPPAPAEAVAPAPPSRPAGRYAAYGLGAAAVVAGGVGAFFGVTAMTQNDALRPKDDPDGTKGAAIRATALNADIAYGAAGALAVAAVVAFLLSSPGPGGASP